MSSADPGAVPDVRIGVAIMHHPRRRDRIPDLVRACAPLAARVVTDPDPDGPPSPLRTAKRAWRAVEDGVTHHLVLQDDILLVRDFAAQLRRAVAQRPGHGISLYSHWDSPQNSYLVRRAAMAGSPFAPLSRHEWTPTQGFVLPAARARELADYLAGIPDEVKDDDEMVVNYCREHDVPVVATVPHLVDHREDPTIVGHEGRFHATVFLADPTLGADHWRLRAATEEALTRRCQPHEPRAYAVELRSSRCHLRLFRPGTGEPAEHYFGWYWADWCTLIGADPDAIIEGFDARADLRGVRVRRLRAVATEVWAAGYLLAADAAGVRGAREEASTAVTSAQLSRSAMATWVESGLSDRDHHRLSTEERRALVGVGLDGAACGWVNATRPPR
ncbi:hypothetical protein [Phytohabitans rumicis]|uniref:Uncharacterized protein n=1 Tax=Phytohabitans rumicis TaxID=1076125 RepID=A0A6V8KY52_9ACTN|nr:hypothetical protein [Phytohabitans rumicis]GFJ86757.1 hypothetical protein Prum_003990 [Phytohabitans rumicis]